MSQATTSTRMPTFEPTPTASGPPHRSDDGRARVGLGTALRRYPMIVLLPVIVLVAAGVTLAVRRHPTYSASTQLNVGTPDASSVATPGQAQAAQQLASSYSLLATSARVYDGVERRLHLSRATVKADLSTDTVPSSSTFYINAKASTSTEAVRVSITASHVLQAAVAASNSSQGPARVLGVYRTMQSRANLLGNAVGRLKADHASPTAINAAQLAFQTAQLQAQAQAGRYNTAVANAVNPNLVILNGARSASSDRRTYVERYGLIGLAAGLVIGAALAYIVALLRTRRRLRTA